jgi:antitoxin component YwqK of YwqJK toxin-antitoxin module
LEYKGNYKNGIMDGKWTYYWNNGKIKAEGLFINGDGHNKNSITKIPTNGRDGKWSSWHQDGGKWCVIYYKNGVKHGSQVNWYENGQKELEGYYESDIAVKTWSWWYFDGSPMQEGTYNDQGKFEGLYFITPPIPEFTYP